MKYTTPQYKQKELRKEQALKHTQEIEKLYPKEIEYSISNTRIYHSQKSFAIPFEELIEVKFTVNNLDTVSSVVDVYNRDSIEDLEIGVLNFASYVNPGGGFINGAMAQEEALCHESFLYNVLSKQNKFYEWNVKHKNDSLYLDRALWSPKIKFRGIDANVLTCAAPNRKAFINRKIFESKDNEKIQKRYHDVLESRIKFIANIFRENKQNVIILGAFGCGVFGNDPEEVAALFKKYLTVGTAKEIIFSIPDEKNRKPFEKIFK